MRIFKTSILTGILIFFSSSLYSQLWQEHAERARIYKKEKKYDSAIVFYNLEKEVLKKGSSGTSTYIDVCGDLGICYYRIKEYTKAEESFKEAVEKSERFFGKKDNLYAESCFDLGKFYMDKKEYKKAHPLFLATKQVKELNFDTATATYAALCDKIGKLYRVMKDYSGALPLFMKAMQVRKKLFTKEDTIYADYCISLANVYLDMEDYENAEHLYLEANEILKSQVGTEHSDHALCCANLGFLYRKKGHYEKAKPYLIDAKEIRGRLKGKEDTLYAFSCNSLALLYKNMGYFEKADTLLREAKQIQKKQSGSESLEYAAFCNNQASLYKDMGNYEGAKLLFKESMGIRERYGTETADYAGSCSNLANLYHQMGSLEQAKELYHRSIEINKKLGKDRSDYAISCNGLAAAYLEMEEYAKAGELYTDARNILKKQLKQGHPDYASTCNGLGVLYEKEKNYKKAEQNYKEAKQIWQTVLGKQHPYYGAACASLANLYWAMDKPNKAEPEYEESFAVNVKNRDAVFQFTNEKEKENFLENVLGEDDKAYSFYFSKKKAAGHPYDLSLFHRNLILNSLEAFRQHIYYSADSTLKNKYLEWQSLREYLSVLYTEPANERKDSIDKIEELAGELEKELVHNLGPSQEHKIKWQDIQDKLKVNEAAIEFIAFHFNPHSMSRRNTDSVLYAAIVLRKDKNLPEMVLLCNEKQLINKLHPAVNKSEEDIITARYKFSQTVNDNKNNINKSLFDLIWSPLEKELNKVETIYFAPAGILHNISFATLPITDTSVLSDRYQLVQFSSTASVTDQKEIFISLSDSLQLYGGIDYEAGASPLKGFRDFIAKKAHTRSFQQGLNKLKPSWEYLSETMTEVDNIQNAGRQSGYPRINMLSDIYASEESIKALDGDSSIAVLHIATHGFFFPKTELKDSLSDLQGKSKAFKYSDNPLLRSGLVFAGANNAWTGKQIVGFEDGILTSYEVSDLYLPRTKLAVLSACETALGDIKGNEGVYGLQRAFKIAGVENLVMSLWKVPSAETKEFMELFYKNIFANQSVSDAFYGAQKEMKIKYRGYPYKWAAWVLLR